MNQITILTSQDFYELFALQSFETARERINYLTKTDFELVAVRAKENFEKQLGPKINFKIRNEPIYNYWGDYLNALRLPPTMIGVYDLTIPGKQMLGYFTFYTSISKKISEHSELILKMPKMKIVVDSPWIFESKDLKIKELKTKVKFFYKLKIGIQTPVVSENFLPKHEECEHEFRLVNNISWEWQLLWQCKHCGFLTYCECFRKALEKSPPPPKDTPIQIYYNEIPLKYPGMVFYPNACDVCRGEESQHMYCSPMYTRSNFEVKYGAYVKKAMIELNLQPDSGSNDGLSREAVNLVRQQLGYKKIGESWFHETELLKIIKSIFPDLTVYHHYRPKWLEGLELDIYVEELELGIEYNEIQHYQPIKHWGGIEALEKVRLRDQKKVKLCFDNNVMIIIFRYDESITKHSVLQKLRKRLMQDSRRWQYAKKYL
ncbi:hypothetical protein HNP65_000336 [Thermosipho japonicus]|uniref:Uncharacterized protein n=1 Tax=Thermosipho japonicus TaxID=90323 RepID=A0A841GLA0_9BACT|nr:hypothetical protein [Thermosipho japonicus]MBB6061914.1 hypothetical protein [Thermosipho japonicus]